MGLHGLLQGWLYPLFLRFCWNLLQKTNALYEDFQAVLRASVAQLAKYLSVRELFDVNVVDKKGTHALFFLII
jgi:hypothetical protein